jgi:hypothetical protein
VEATVVVESAVAVGVAAGSEVDALGMVEVAAAERLVVVVDSAACVHQVREGTVEEVGREAEAMAAGEPEVVARGAAVSEAVATAAGEPAVVVPEEAAQAEVALEAAVMVTAVSEVEASVEAAWVEEELVAAASVAGEKVAVALEVAG